MRKQFLCPALLAGLLFFPSPCAQAASVSASDLKPALEQLLRENPEILLDFLRQHSETVLDIAQQGSNLRREANMVRQWKSDRETEKKVALEGRPMVGDPSARVRIVAFSDFTCQYCQRAESTVEALLKEYKGKVSFVFKNMPLEPKGISGLASQYFVAIGMLDQDLAWKFYRRLFNERDKLILDGEAYLRRTATDIGVNLKQLDRKRRSKAVAAILDEDLKDADALQIEGTPYFLVNNLVIRGAIPKDLFRKAIEMELKRK